MIADAVLAITLLVGVLVIAGGLIARRGGGGTFLIVIGAVIALVPIGSVVSTLVTRQLTQLHRESLAGDLNPSQGPARET